MEIINCKQCGILLAEVEGKHYGLEFKLKNSDRFLTWLGSTPHLVCNKCGTDTPITVFTLVKVSDDGKVAEHYGLAAGRFATM